MGKKKYFRRSWSISTIIHLGVNVNVHFKTLISTRKTRPTSVTAEPGDRDAADPTCPEIFAHDWDCTLSAKTDNSSCITGSTGIKISESPRIRTFSLLRNDLIINFHFDTKKIRTSHKEKHKSKHLLPWHSVVLSFTLAIFSLELLLWIFLMSIPSA